MKQSLARRGAAVATAAALALGASALLAPSAHAKAKPLKGSVSGTVSMNCEIDMFDDSDFVYDATIKLSGTRAKKADKVVTLKATFSKLPGVSPAPIDNDTESKLGLTVGGTKATLKGKGHSTAGIREEVPVPAAKGKASNKSNSLAIVVTSFSMTIPDYGMSILCTPAEGQGALGTLKLK